MHNPRTMFAQKLLILLYLPKCELLCIFWTPLNIVLLMSTPRSWGRKVHAPCAPVTDSLVAHPLRRVFVPPKGFVRARNTLSGILPPILSSGVIQFSKNASQSPDSQLQHARPSQSSQSQSPNSSDSRTDSSRDANRTNSQQSNS